LSFGRLGNEGATACALHQAKYVGMPIWMVSADGQLRYPSHCLATYPRNQDAVPPECSYVWQAANRHGSPQGDEQPQWHMGYTPSMPENVTEK